jgi:hypothetical protein
MHSISKSIILDFLERIGEKFPQGISLYLLGGSALCLIGNPRVTNDIDYTFESTTEDEEKLRSEWEYGNTNRHPADPF